jgi:hypothetical protein
VNDYYIKNLSTSQALIAYRGGELIANVAAPVLIFLRGRLI